MQEIILETHLHKKKYKSKPKESEVGRISNEITDKITEIDVDRFAQEVAKKGRTFTLAIFKGRRRTENFICQQIYGLDFDGGLSFEEFMDRAEEFAIRPSVIYTTFSSTKKNPRFRVIFVSDCKIYDKEAAMILTQMLQNIFPESDKNCKDITRMFFGGKGLLYKDKSATINVLDISLSLQAYLRSKYRKNYGRKIKEIGSKLKVRVKNGSLCIHREMQRGIGNEELLAMTNLYIRVDARDSSFFYVIEKKEALHSLCRQRCEKYKADKIRGISKEILMQSCSLIRDFYEGDITHEQKFLIATNLLHISNGRDLFFMGHINHYEKWKEDWNYITKYEYFPKKCENSDCPYYEGCRSPTILDRISHKIIKKKMEEYVEIEESEKSLRDYMLKAVNEKDKGIYLISAQTALGKTSTYCKIIKNHYTEKAFMIVVPTTKLQREVGKELEKLGIPVFLTENIKYLLKEMKLDELEERVIDLYKKGFSYKVKPVIKEYIKDKAIDDTKYKRLDAYFKEKDKMDGSRCVITTHALFLTLPEEILDKYEIIIDEDILMSIFKNTASISFKSIRTALEKGVIPKKEQYFVEQLLLADDDCIESKEASKLQINQLNEIYEKKLEIQESLIDFLQAVVYHVDKKNKRVDFFNAKKLPDKKMTIVSATLNEELYKTYCPDKKIYLMCVPIAKYKGNLCQYTAHSMSRSKIEEIGIKKIEKNIKRIVGEKEKNTITFKIYAEKAEIYYGKSEGYNEYKGKDLVLIGTPHNVPFIYQLIGTYLGYKAEDKLSVRITENDTYLFRFMTYKDKDMRNLQFYFIESELEQAIGRARLLRFDCNVYLFSNYPCKQAALIQDEYLEDE